MIAGDGKKLGLYGFGAAAHIVAQVAKWQGRSVFAFTRPGDVATQAFARSLGATWAGGSDEMPPEPLDAAIIFATVGDLVPLALKAVRKGGRVVCAGIHMSDIPSFPYRLLWEERQLVSVANLTRQDGIDFLRLAPKIGIVTKTTTLSAQPSQPSPCRSPRRPVRRRGGSRAMSVVKRGSGIGSFLVASRRRWAIETSHKWNCKTRVTSGFDFSSGLRGNLGGTFIFSLCFVAILKLSV